ncbi:MEDS domain-containing protein [Bradyrhizobium sp. 62]|nr:MEDS domain-containing protein [Bradyrhizobium sp. 62]
MLFRGPHSLRRLHASRTSACLCFFCSANDEYNTLLPFICDGLDCGHRAFHVLPERHVDDHVTRLRSAGIDVEAAQRSGQLEIALPQDTYLRTGRFDKEDMLNLIQQVLGNGAALGFPLTRIDRTLRNRLGQLEEQE